MNWIFGDNINTDLMTPGRFNTTVDPYKLARIAFREYLPEFSKKVKKKDFIVAGKNFGCGSSRETAATALKYSHIAAILAKSFARIFYRNCMNIGLLLVAVDTNGIEKDDELFLDSRGQVLINKTKKTRQKVVIPAMMRCLHKQGGIIPYLQKHGLESLADLEKF
ncbi:3-isopropylmalate dehydratase [Candidatus Gottesmanbacteria bacterium]|nr:3-isopropylmalate dehydratase [Candidatus Gottesmanbacteria bacterium]